MVVKSRDTAVLSIPASDKILKCDVQKVLSELERVGIKADIGSFEVSLKPTINSNNGG